MRFLVLLLLMIARTGFGQIYTWVDENGQQHFSDRKPPQGVDYQARQTADTDLLSSYTATERQEIPRASTENKPRRSAAGRRRVARADAAEKRCQGYLKRMKRVQAQLRRGYREPKGNQLRRQRRELSRRYQDECR